MSVEKVVRFVTDLPKSPKDMAERLKKVPLWYKAASAVTIASLAACQLSEKFGYVAPPPEGTRTNHTETIPLGCETDGGYLNPNNPDEYTPGIYNDKWGNCPPGWGCNVTVPAVGECVPPDFTPKPTKTSK